MSIRRVVPVIPTDKMDETRKFYTEFMCFDLAMDMEWIITFAAPENPTAQISFVKGIPDGPNIGHAISIEVSDVDQYYSRAVQMDVEITKEITNEAWGVRRFFVKDPTGITLNILSHIKTDSDVDT